MAINPLALKPVEWDLKKGSFGHSEVGKNEEIFNKSQMALAVANEKPVPKSAEPTPKKYIVAVDFDGTVVTHEYPKVGKDVKHAVEVLKQIVAQDAKIILYTMRSGKELESAINWFMERGIPLYGVNKNPDQFSWSESPKAYANLYIDDAALGCPLIYDVTISGRPFVDWIAVDRLLQKHNWYINSR